MRRIFNYPKTIATLNSVFIILAIFANRYYQVFCNPVSWARAVLIIVAVNAILFPLIKSNSWLFNISSLINGFSVFVFLYCIIFLEKLNIIGLVLPIIYLPLFLLLQIIYWNVLSNHSILIKRYFQSGIACSILVIVTIGVSYNRELSNFKNVQDHNYEGLERNYLTERVLGMHFIYHTRFCEFDGWRPPKHDPILVIGMWLNGRKDPIDLILADRVALYKKTYPFNPVKFECSCAQMYSVSYHKDSLWE